MRMLLRDDRLHTQTDYTFWKKKKEKRVIQTGNAKIHPYRAHSTDLSRSSSLRSTRASRIANISAVDRTRRGDCRLDVEFMRPGTPTPDHASTMRHQPGHRKLRVLGWCGARTSSRQRRQKPTHTPSCPPGIIHRFLVIGGSDRFGGDDDGEHVVVTRRSPCAGRRCDRSAAPDRGSQRTGKKEWIWAKREMRA